MRIAGTHQEAVTLKFRQTLTRLSSAARGCRQPRGRAVVPRRLLGKLLSVPVASVLMASLAGAGLLAGIRQAGGLQVLELLAFDQLVRTLPQAGPDPRLLIVGIDESDLQGQKQLPLSDEVVAQLLEALQQYEPKVIGLDLYRNVPKPPGRERLLRALQADNVIAITQLPLGSHEAVPPPPGVPASRVGFSDLVIDPDNVVRRNLLYLQSPSGTQKVYSFSLQVSLHYLAERGLPFQVLPDALKIGQTPLARLRADSGGYRLPPGEAEGWQILLKYRGEKVARQVSLKQVLTGKLDPSWVRDRAVLVGIVAPSGQDTVPTPYSSSRGKDFEMPGVAIHGQSTSQILSAVLEGEGQFWFWQEWQEVLWLWVWSLAGGILVWRCNHPLSLGLSLGIASASLWGTGWLAFSYSGWIPFLPPLLGLIATSLWVLAYKVVYRTYHDPLTGLPNRRSFIQHLQRAQVRNVPFQADSVSVLFLNLDRFKIVNDALGHSAGDSLLLSAAKRLKASLPPGAYLGRVGGDEFAICLNGPSHPGGAGAVGAVADEIQTVLTQPFLWQGKEIFTTVSIGIASSQVGRDLQPEELLRHADIALYKAKELGKARHEVFATGMDVQALKRWQLEADLREALKQQEFLLYYQPIVSLQHGKLVGFEALVRWQSLQRGLVSPGTFIPVAEETGAIVPLGQWILQEACRQILCWQQQFPRYRSSTISVNLSSRQFSHPDLVGQVEQILTAVGLSGNYLKLEITESLMVNDVEGAIDLLRRLKALGIQLSIDDFGTGYSSLSYLHRFPLDTLKVDKSFIGQIHSSDDRHKYAQIVRTIVTLGHNLNLAVTAEGIETAEQVEVLKAFACEYGQGYFFSPPLPKEAAEALLAEDPQW